MSRNLGETSCHECPGGHDDIVLEGPIREVTAKEDPGYYEDHAGLLIAEARCILCHTLYFAWVDWVGSPYSHWQLRTKDRGVRFCDLSYRHSFNDEPSPEDLPVYDVVMVPSRTPAKEHTYMKFGSDEDRAVYAARREATIAKRLSLSDERALRSSGKERP